MSFILAIVISSADIFGNLANMIYTIGSAIRNAFYLRFAIVFGAIFEILYSSLIVDRPLWTPIIWAIVIILVNCYFIFLHYYEKYSVNLSEDELRIYNNLFHRMDKMLFQKFIKMAKRKEWEPGKDIIKEGKASDRIYLLHEGVSEVIVNDQPVAYIHSGAFVGEMSFLTGSLPSATVRTMVPSIIFSWDKADVKKMVDKNTGFKSEFQQILSSDLILKIIRQNKKEAK